MVNKRLVEFSSLVAEDTREHYADDISRQTFVRLPPLLRSLPLLISRRNPQFRVSFIQSSGAHLENPFAYTVGRSATSYSPFFFSFSRESFSSLSLSLFLYRGRSDPVDVVGLEASFLTEFSQESRKRWVSARRGSDEKARTSETEVG